MDNNLKKVSKTWSNYSKHGHHARLFWWQAGPEVQRHINQKITGDAETSWQKYTLKNHFSGRLPLGRCLSLGCGNGHLERSLAQLDAFVECDAYDIAEGSIKIAQQIALEADLTNLHYYVADVNTIILPEKQYDAVWINAAMHHFQALEHVSFQVHRSLKPGGLLILNEYIGPNRFQFSTRQKEIVNLCLRLLPQRYRLVMPEALDGDLIRNPISKGPVWFFSRVRDKFQDGDLLDTLKRRFQTYYANRRGIRPQRDEVRFPTQRDIIAGDPSEAVRSADILDVIQQYFNIIEKKDWGGNIFQFLLESIAGNFSEDDPQSQELLRMIFNVEETLLACGEFSSDYAYIVAKPHK